MEVALARQPILNIDESIFAYELLFRPLSDDYREFDGDKATARVITDSLDMIGLQDITGDKRGFINFTESLIKSEVPTILPRDKIGVEIIEDVGGDREVIRACKRLKDDGYILVLDDFTFERDYVPLLDLVDIVKIDFLNSSKNNRKDIVDKLQDRDVKLLAEKVESREDFQEAKEQGYSYLQGFYFHKPNIISGQSLPNYKVNQIRLLNEVNKLEPDFERIEKIVKNDASMSYSILRIINSPYYELRFRVKSIKQAIVLLGLREFKKWLNLYILRGLGVKKPKVLLNNSLIRAKFCEKIASLLDDEQRKLDYFTMGLFSLVNSILDRPIEKIIEELFLPDDIVDALLFRKGKTGEVLKLIINYEKGNWESVDYFIDALKLNNSRVSRIYYQSVKAANIIDSALE